MKIALVSADGCGAWFLLRLIEEGNQCDYYLLEQDKTQSILSGLVPAPRFQEPKNWRGYDLVLFDGSSDGQLADKIRKQAPVLGCSEVSCALEDDRLFGLDAMKEMGIDVPLYEPFDSPESARKWLSKHPDRYVYKPFQTDSDEEIDCSVTYVSHSLSDLDQNLDRLFEESKGANFLLQKFVEGVEISTEGWFDGSQFHFVNHTLEEKKFLAGGYGQNIGCSGNIVWSCRSHSLVYQRGLMRGREWFRDHDYRGMVDLNTIVTRTQVFGLEWTPRFGYHSGATLLNLIGSPLTDFFTLFSNAPEGGVSSNIGVKFDFGAAIDISVPPFPCSEIDAKPGQPIEGIDPSQAWRDTYLYDAMMKDDSLVTAGVNGDIGCVLSRGHTFRGAWENALDQVRKVKAPDLQWRIDLETSTGKRYRKLQETGWI